MAPATLSFLIKTRTVKYFPLFLLFALCCWTQGLQAQERRSVDPFRELRISGMIDAVLIPSDREEVVFEVRGAKEDILDVEHRGSELRISLINRIYEPDIYVRAEIYYKELDYLRAFAGAEVRSDLPLRTGSEAEIRSAAGAEVYLELTADKLYVAVTEGGSAALTGAVRDLEVSAQTGGIFDGVNLTSETAYARAALGGEAAIYATQRLEARTNTGGEISYRGEPEKIYTKTFLGGNVRRLHDK